MNPLGKATFLEAIFENDEEEGRSAPKIAGGGRPPHFKQYEGLFGYSFYFFPTYSSSSTLLLVVVVAAVVELCFFSRVC